MLAIGRSRRSCHSQTGALFCGLGAANRCLIKGHILAFCQMHRSWSRFRQAGSAFQTEMRAPLLIWGRPTYHAEVKRQHHVPTRPLRHSGWLSCVLRFVTFCCSTLSFHMETPHENRKGCSRITRVTQPGGSHRDTLRTASRVRIYHGYLGYTTLVCISPVVTYY